MLLQAFLNVSKLMFSTWIFSNQNIDRGMTDFMIVQIVHMLISLFQEVMILKWMRKILNLHSVCHCI